MWRARLVLVLALAPGCRRSSSPLPPPAPAASAIASVAPSAAAAPTPPALEATPARGLPEPARLADAFRGTSPRGFLAATSGNERVVRSLPAESAPAPTQPVLVASFTKLWTAVALLRLVEKKELTLETTIADVLPDLGKRVWADATLLELMTHTSRVPEFDDKAGYYTRAGVDFSDPIAALVANVPHDRTERRGTFKYKNAEYAIAGAILAARAHASAAAALEREVFTPASMKHAGLFVTRAPAGLDLSPMGRVRPQNFFTAGAGYASAEDLLSFFDALAGDALLTASSKAILFDGATARARGALGCWASPFANGEGGTTLLVERPGSFGNVRLFSAFFPEERRAVVAWSSTPVEMGHARAGKGIGYALTRAVLE